MNTELTTLLQQIQRYFEQRHELFGENFFPFPSSNDSTKEIEINIQKEELFMTPQQPTTTTAQILFPDSDNAQKLSYPQEHWIHALSLYELNNLINTCTKCSLGHLRKNFVFGVGNPQAEVVVVGEAPGADEDEQGEPFVGRAGQLLTKILEAIHFKREEVFICNVLKCRPPNNRDPLPEEIECCEPYLWKQLELLKPKAILCAGRIAGQALLKTNATLAQLRGKVHSYRGIPLMVTYHPAALLRNPNWKRPCWEDVQQFRKLYDDLKK